MHHRRGPRLIETISPRKGSPQTCRLRTGLAQSCWSGFRRVVRTVAASEVRALPSEHTREEANSGGKELKTRAELGFWRSGPPPGGLRERLGLGSPGAGRQGLLPHPPAHPIHPTPETHGLRVTCPPSPASTTPPHPSRAKGESAERQKSPRRAGRRAQGPRGSPDLAGTPGPGPARLGAGEEAGGGARPRRGG